MMVSGKFLLLGIKCVLNLFLSNSQLVAEYSTHLAETPRVGYLTADHLGSTRIITNENGVVANRKDYAAFGDETITAQRTNRIVVTDPQGFKASATTTERKWLNKAISVRFGRVY